MHRMKARKWLCGVVALLGFGLATFMSRQPEYVGLLGLGLLTGVFGLLDIADIKQRARVGENAALDRVARREAVLQAVSGGLCLAAFVCAVSSLSTFAALGSRYLGLPGWTRVYEPRDTTLFAACVYGIAAIVYYAPVRVGWPRWFWRRG